MGDSLSPHGRPENQTQLPAGTAVEAQWCCRMFGAELGPMPIEALRWMVESDQLDAQDLVRCGTGDSWQAVEEVAELRMLLKDKSSLENSSATTDPRPNPVLSPDEWYYQIDGTEHGPFSLADLQNLVGSSGDTAREVAVRRGLDGAWSLGTRVSNESQSAIRTTVRRMHVQGGLAARRKDIVGRNTRFDKSLAATLTLRSPSSRGCSLTLS
jgi:hypothetical protein